jgi:acetyltransferase-like isoleucine patch superfamily enzyme
MFDVGSAFEGGINYHRYKPIIGRHLPKETFIGHDVWIGHGAYIRAGIKIGNGAIVAAHSVVVGDVPPYAIVAGNPAKIKRFRFAEDIVAALERLRWWRFAIWD